MLSKCHVEESPSLHVRLKKYFIQCKRIWLQMKRSIRRMVTVPPSACAKPFYPLLVKKATPELLVKREPILWAQIYQTQSREHWLSKTKCKRIDAEKTFSFLQMDVYNIRIKVLPPQLSCKVLPCFLFFLMIKESQSSLRTKTKNYRKTVK